MNKRMSQNKYVNMLLCSCVPSVASVSLRRRATVSLKRYCVSKSYSAMHLFMNHASRYIPFKSSTPSYVR